MQWQPPQAMCNRHTQCAATPRSVRPSHAVVGFVQRATAIVAFAMINVKELWTVD